MWSRRQWPLDSPWSVFSVQLYTMYVFCVWPRRQWSLDPPHRGPFSVCVLLCSAPDASHTWCYGCMNYHCILYLVFVICGITTVYYIPLYTMFYMWHYHCILCLVFVLVCVLLCSAPDASRTWCYGCMNYHCILCLVFVICGTTTLC